MTEEQTLLLVEFARACKGAARSVALYPPTHPALRAALARIVSAAARLTADGDLTLTIAPEAITINGRQAFRSDFALVELAQLLHGRMAGALRVQRDADANDWHALLVQLARPAEEVIADGGLARAWARTGGSRFEIRDIDYAEVLRERQGGASADWDRIIAFCLQSDRMALDERTIAALLEALGDAGQFAALLHRLDESPTLKGASIGARTAAMLQLLKAAVHAARDRGDGADVALQTIAEAVAHLPAGLLAGLATYRRGDDEEAWLAGAITVRMSDDAIATFVAGAITADGGATERLAHAFEALVRDDDRRERVLTLARDRAAAAHDGDPAFDTQWQAATEMLRSYSDRDYVSAAYARELFGARARAIEVEQVANDPPERVTAWLHTVSAATVGQLDVAMLSDLLRIEALPDRWNDVAATVADEVERRTQQGSADDARALLEALDHAAADWSRPAIAGAAAAMRDRIASGRVVPHLLQQLRKADEGAVEPFLRLGAALGPACLRPLADALAAEDHPRAIRRLRELLLGFGAAGREVVEQLKRSFNPAVRRTAIDVLRLSCADDALPGLASMLGDADPQVQREAIRAIAVIGTGDAYAVLEAALVSGTARGTILQQLIGLRDLKAIPLLCHVLEHTPPRRGFARVHVSIIDALGNAGEHPQSTQVLRGILFGGSWRAPLRTAMLRRAAAMALGRIGSADALAVLAEAARCRSLGVRSAVRAGAMLLMNRERGAA